MDDLKLLRDLGAELEHGPPPTLVRQRTRYLQDRPRRRWNAWWTAGLVAVATVCAVAVPTVLVSPRHLANLAGPPAGGEAVDVSGAMNVLLIGSDTRKGEGNAKYGPRSQDGGQRADTIIVVHMPADRSRATAVSVPRDSLVRAAPCTSGPARTVMINALYDEGGAACLKKTLEKLTGLPLHHTMAVDFAGFEDMVDALGGVTVKVPKPVNEPKAKLRLPAGEQVLDGEKALGYVRLRYYGDDGSDLSRIKRQRTVVMALLKKAQAAVAVPGKLQEFLGVMRGTVKTDLTVEEMYALAIQLAETKVSLTVVPTAEHPEDRNRLQWKQPEAGRLFASLK